MVTLFIIVVIIGVVCLLAFIFLLIWSRIAKGTKEPLPDFAEPTEDTWNWSHNTAHFKIKGLSYYRVTEGHKEAYIVAELHNPHDENAILVVTREGKPLGHLPRGNSYLHRELIEKYSRYLPVNAVIHSEEGVDGAFYYGYVDLCLETYPNFDRKKFVTEYI